MENETEQYLKAKMEYLRSICDREIQVQQQIIDSFAASFPTSLNFIKSLALDTAQNHAKLAKMKADSREAEDELVKVLAAKTRKEAKQMDTRDSISAIKARGEKLRRTVRVQRARRDEYGSIISQESLALAKIEEKPFHGTTGFLVFIIEGGYGVKFTFNDTNIENPKQEYSFTIRHVDDAYSLLDCNPHLNDIKELINELNRTNGFFKFVRIMREKFREAATLGLQPQSTSFHQDSSAISMSGPALSVSTDRSESSTKKNEHHMPLQEVNGPFKEVNHRSKSSTKTNENKIYDGRFNRLPRKPTQIFNCQSPLLEAKK
ncbi:hypothetical protein HRI_000817500 [Hibiscus trionum]|uniref:Kinetochore protein SPC25 n=1 Tax=Hibiscus trionum TaxID=183268 RepID=A0A9W7H5P8_HIBTR|nr:hypothetical protein HRI_000817500 [Hibiscus trionum]